MNDLKDVRKRIRSRRNGYDTEDTKSSFSLFRLFYRFIMVIMCVCVLVLALLLNEKMKWVKMPAFIDQLHLESIASWLPFDNWFSLKDETVGAKSNYQLQKDNQYSNGSNQAQSIADGVVAYIQKGDDGKYTVTLKQDNGVITTYGNLNDVQIKEKERIVKQSTIGTYDTFITMNFTKNNETITIDEASKDES